MVCASTETPQEGAIRAAHDIVGLEITLDRRVSKIKHAVTHHKITLYGYIAHLIPPDSVPQALDCADLRWVSPTDLDHYAFSSPQALLRSALHTFLSRGTRGDLQAALSFEEERTES